MRHLEVSFENGLKLDFATNMNEQDFYAAIENWKLREPVHVEAKDKEQAEISFWRYIKSKQTDDMAVPLDLWNAL